ncbi:hypothetical protein P8452_77416 [Trifolium repens]|nr:hypothetical protein P8452_77416 [Trifolium repens]
MEDKCVHTTMGETQEELNSEVVQQLKDLASLVNIVLKNTEELKTGMADLKASCSMIQNSLTTLVLFFILANKHL